MRAHPLVFLTVFLMACPKQTTAPVVAIGPVHPDLICPENTQPAGQVPPVGYEAWCHEVTAAGRWLRRGPSLTFHNNGEKSSQGDYLADRKQGPWILWYPTGQVERQGSFAGGVEDGFWVRYHTNGEQSSEGKMVNGHEHEMWTYWSENGATRTEGNWALGKRDGTWVDFDRVTERTIAERDYRAGRLVSSREL